MGKPPPNPLGGDGSTGPQQRIGAVGEGGPGHPDDILGGALQAGWREICKKGKTNTTPSMQGSQIINLNHFASFVNDNSTLLHSCKENVSFVDEAYCSGLVCILGAKFRGNIHVATEWKQQRIGNTWCIPCCETTKSFTYNHCPQKWIGYSLISPLAWS